MNDIYNIKTPDYKKQKGFLHIAAKRIETICSNLSKSKEKYITLDNVNTINSLDISANVKAELLAKFDEELEKFNHKVIKN
jgi:hypothetical protein